MRPLCSNSLALFFVPLLLKGLFLDTLWPEEERAACTLLILHTIDKIKSR